MVSSQESFIARTDISSVLLADQADNCARLTKNGLQGFFWGEQVAKQSLDWGAKLLDNAVLGIKTSIKEAPQVLRGENGIVYQDLEFVLQAVKGLAKEESFYQELGEEDRERYFVNKMTEYKTVLLQVRDKTIPDEGAALEVNNFFTKLKMVFERYATCGQTPELLFDCLTEDS